MKVYVKVFKHIFLTIEGGHQRSDPMITDSQLLSVRYILPVYKRHR